MGYRFPRRKSAFEELCRAIYWATPIPHTLQREPDIALLCNWCCPGSCAIDVGASVGLYTKALSKKVGIKGQVIAIEPSRSASRLLSRVVTLQQLTNVRLERFAAAEHQAKKFIITPVNLAGYPQDPLSYVSDAPEVGSESFAINTLSLDEYCARNKIENVSVVKLDIEGYELAALKGARRLIENNRPVLLVEITTQHTARYDYCPEVIWAELESMAYVPHISDNGTGRRQVRQYDGAHTNYLWIPSEKCLP